MEIMNRDTDKYRISQYTLLGVRLYHTFEQIEAVVRAKLEQCNPDRFEGDRKEAAIYETLKITNAFNVIKSLPIEVPKYTVDEAIRTIDDTLPRLKSITNSNDYATFPGRAIQNLLDIRETIQRCRFVSERQAASIFKNYVLGRDWDKGK